MPPDTAHHHARSLDHLCSPPSVGPGSADAGLRNGGEHAKEGRTRGRGRGAKRSQTENFFQRSPSEGGPSRHLPTRDRSEEHSGFVRAPSEGARQQQRHRQTQSRPPSLMRPGKDADSSYALANRLSFDFAMSQRTPAVAFSGPLPRRTLEQWGEDALVPVPRGTPPALQRGPGTSTSWVEGRGKQESWQHRAKRWLLLKPSARARERGAAPPFASLIPLSDGALGMTLREEPEDQPSPLTPSSRKALFCPSSQSFLESVSNSTW